MYTAARMSAQRRDPPAEDIQALHDRYLLEVVEALGLCPFARRCREQGRLARPLFYAETGEGEPAAVARTLVDLGRAQPDVEVVLLTFVLPRAADHPWHEVDSFESLVRDIYRRA